MHVGQLVCDQALSHAVEATSPIRDQHAGRDTQREQYQGGRRAADERRSYRIFFFWGDGRGLRYVLAWISFAVNVSYACTVLEKAFCYEGWGVVNPDFPSLVLELNG